MKGKTRVSYADFSVREFFTTWKSQTISMVVARNSLREEFYNVGIGYLEEMKAGLREGGIFIVDDNVAAPLMRVQKEPIWNSLLRYPVPDFMLDFIHVGNFNLSGEGEAYVFRQPNRPTP